MNIRLNNYKAYFPEVRRISVGHCGARGKWNFYKAEIAHCHTDTNDPYYNYLCFFEAVPFFEGKPTAVFLHEYGHALNKPFPTFTGTQSERISYGHDDDWREIFSKLLHKYKVAPIIQPDRIAIWNYLGSSQIPEELDPFRYDSVFSLVDKIKAIPLITDFKDFSVNGI